jgi:hypothetical protein
MKQSNFIIELQYQYLNYITGIPVLCKILKKIHNTGKKNYTSDRQVQEIPIMHESECYFLLHLVHQNSCLVFAKKT